MTRFVDARQMTVWKQVTIENFYADDTPSDSGPCEVRISNGAIIVSIEGESGFDVWKGAEVPIGSGHFKLRASASRRADLHRAPDSDSIVGSWTSEGAVGMCRIDLDDAEE
jgi:hypothetical protein